MIRDSVYTFNYLKEYIVIKGKDFKGKDIKCIYDIKSFSVYTFKYLKRYSV